jgi:hypothetical protein
METCPTSCAAKRPCGFGYKNITRLRVGERVMLNQQYPFVIKVRRT